MLKIIIRQANWGFLGSIFAFIIGFFVKRYVFNEVGTIEWGKYATAHTFVVISDTLLSLSMPFIILKFVPKLLNKSSEKASELINIFFRYAVCSSFFFILLMIIISPFLDILLYNKINNFSPILLVVSLHAPFAIFMGIITSLYRSVLKIKEIVLYGTFVTVILKAILTFLVFSFSPNIISFIILELVTQFIVLLILFYLFNKREFNILSFKRVSNNKIDSDIIKYGKNMYGISLIGMLSNQSIAFILGISLPSEHMGIYSVLLAITSLSLFLNKNIRAIVSPAISKLHSEGKFDEIRVLYKQTTFIVSLLAIPFSILIIFFSLEIFSFYSLNHDLSAYRFHLCVLIISNIISLLVGTSHTLMIMAGLERKAFQIQFIRGLLVLIFSSLFIKLYKLDAVVVISLFSVLFVSSFQLFFMKKRLDVSPFSRELFILLALSLPLVYFAISQNMRFELHHFFLLPLGIYALYFSVFYYKIKEIYLSLK